MSSELRIPSTLRRFTDGQSKLEVNSSTVGEVLSELFQVYPEIKNHLIEENGSLRNFVNFH